MSTTVTYSDEELSTIARAYLKTRRSMRNRPRRVTDDLIANAKNQTGGEGIIIPWEVGNHSNTTQMSTGYEPVSLAAAPIHKPGTDTWCFCIRPVLISLKDDIVNRGSGKVIDRLQTRTKNVEDGMRADIEQQVLADTVTAMNDLNTLNGMDNSYGFLEEHAVGSQSNTVHGLAKTVYGTLPGFQNQIYDCNANASNTLLPALRSVTSSIRDLVDDDAKLTGYCTVAFLNNYKRCLQSSEIYASSDPLDGGRRALTYDGIPLRTTNLLPSAGTTSTGDPWSCVILDHSSIYLMAQSGYLLPLDDFRPVSGHIVRAAFMYFFAQLVVEYYGTSALIWDGNTW